MTTVSVNTGQLTFYARLPMDKVGWLVGMFPHGTMRVIKGLSVHLYDNQGQPIFEALFNEQKNDYRVRMTPALIDAANREFPEFAGRKITPLQ